MGTTVTLYILQINVSRIIRKDRAFADIRHIPGRCLAYIALMILRPDDMSTLTTERIVTGRNLVIVPSQPDQRAEHLYIYSKIKIQIYRIHLVTKSLSLYFLQTLNDIALTLKFILIIRYFPVREIYIQTSGYLVLHLGSHFVWKP